MKIVGIQVTKVEKNREMTHGEKKATLSINDMSGPKGCYNGCLAGKVLRLKLNYEKPSTIILLRRSRTTSIHENTS